MESGRILSEKELDIRIDETIKKNIDNRKLQQDINTEFAKKGLDQRIAKCLFNRTKLVGDISKMEKMTLANCMHSFLNDNRFNLKKYYEHKDIVEWMNYREVEERVEVITCEKFRMVDEYEYHGDLTFEQIYTYMKNSLFLYYPETQRSGVYSNKRQKGCVREVNINRKAVNEIADLILKDEFETTEIILNCMQFEGHESKFKFIPKFENIGDIIIKPNYDLDDFYYTICTILDGYHRILGICKAYEKKLEMGEKLEKVISCKLVLADLERAKRIVSSVFKRTDDDKSWLKTLDVNDYTKFADAVISSSKTLKGKVSNVYEECKVEGTVTYKALIIDTIKKLDIDVSNRSSVLFTSRKIGDKLDLIYEYIKESNNNSFFDECADNPNIFCGYITLAYLLKDKELDFEKLELLKNILDSFDKTTLLSLKLDYKQYKKNLIIKTFEKIVDKVVDNYVAEE